MAQSFKEYHEMVDADWHDGYEEQAEAIDEWFTGVIPVLQSVSFPPPFSLLPSTLPPLLSSSPPLSLLATPYSLLLPLSLISPFLMAILGTQSGIC